MGQEIDSPDVLLHYMAPFAAPEDRGANAKLGRLVFHGRDEFVQLQVGLTMLATRPAQIIWGMRDPILDKNALRRMTSAFPASQVVRIAEAGHFVLEAAPEKVLSAVSDFLNKTIASELRS